jgi:hypothetical protein
MPGDDAAVITAPAKKKKIRRYDMSPCPECGEMVDNAATRCPYCRTALEVDEEAQYKRWRKCPNCGQQKAKRVLWTFWGSFYFSALFHHVSCQECGTCYNGRTGQSNVGPAILIMSVVVMAIGGLGRLIVYFFERQGYDVQDWLGIACWCVTGLGLAGAISGVTLWLALRSVAGRR